MIPRLVAAIALVSAALSARADTYSFSFTGTGLNGSGTLTTAGSASTAYSLVTSFTGTQNGSAITLFGVNTFAGNDNLFEGGSPFFDFAGLSYSVGGDNYNLFGNTAGQVYDLHHFNGGQTNGTLVSFMATPNVATTPEPSSFALLGTGIFGAMGILRRQRLVKEGEDGQEADGADAEAA